MYGSQNQSSFLICSVSITKKYPGLIISNILIVSGSDYFSGWGGSTNSVLSTLSPDDCEPKVGHLKKKKLKEYGYISSHQIILSSCLSLLELCYWM